jgi:hypothetical protein
MNRARQNAFWDMCVCVCSKGLSCRCWPHFAVVVWTTHLNTLKMFVLYRVLPKRTAQSYTNRSWCWIVASILFLFVVVSNGNAFNENKENQTKKKYWINKFSVKDMLYNKQSDVRSKESKKKKHHHINTRDTTISTPTYLLIALC